MRALTMPLHVARMLTVAVLCAVASCHPVHAAGLEARDNATGNPTSLSATSKALDVYDTGAGTDVLNGTRRVELCQCDYETVAASQSDQVMGGAGGAGDYLWAIWAVPATTSPGAVSIKDGSGSSITLFTGGASSVSDLKPFPIALPDKAVSTNGAWKVTVGANLSVIVSGRFTP